MVPSNKIRDVRYKGPVKEIGKRKLSDQHRAAVQELFILMNHYRGTLVNLEGTLRQLLLDGYGVDIASGEWQLNMATGELVQAPKPSPVAPAQGQ